VRISDLSGQIFDFAATRPEGFTRAELNEAIGYHPRCTLDRAIRQLRLILADDDSINLIANKPPIAGGQWVYQLVGTVADATWWSNNRRRDCETRLRTILAVNRSVAAGTAPRTIDGRRARLMDKSLTRLIEDLDELNAAI
jgi:hypothetical protein